MVIDAFLAGATGQLVSQRGGKEKEKDRGKGDSRRKQDGDRRRGIETLNLSYQAGRNLGILPMRP